MGHRSTDAVPVCSLVSEHAEVGIAYVVYHLIGCRHVEAITEPIDCHLSRCHGIEHEILQVLQCLGVGEKCFVHVSTIHGLRCCAYFVCHLVNWLGRLTSLYHLAGKLRQTASHRYSANSSLVANPFFISYSSTMLMISSINCSRLINISSMGLGTKVLVLFISVVCFTIRNYRDKVIDTTHCFVVHFSVIFFQKCIAILYSIVRISEVLGNCFVHEKSRQHVYNTR